MNTLLQKLRDDLWLLPSASHTIKRWKPTPSCPTLLPTLLIPASMRVSSTPRSCSNHPLSGFTHHYLPRSLLLPSLCACPPPRVAAVWQKRTNTTVPIFTDSTTQNQYQKTVQHIPWMMIIMSHSCTTLGAEKSSHLSHSTRLECEPSPMMTGWGGG